jgi:hypothetical protein
MGGSINLHRVAEWRATIIVGRLDHKEAILQQIYDPIG